MGRILSGILLVFVLVPAQKGLAMSFDMKAAKKMYRHAMMDVFAKNTMKTPRFSAHRGSQAYGPENTIVSFEAAGRNGVWAIETDFRMTKDGEIVCIHDKTLDRTTNGSGNVSDYTLAELRQFKVQEVNSTVISNKTYNYGNFSHEELRIPTIDEYLDICVKYHCVPFIELKEDGGVIAKVIAAVKRHGLEGSCIYSSSQMALLKEVRRQGCLEVVHLISAQSSDIMAMLELGNASMAFNIKDFSMSIKDKYRFGRKNPATPRDLVKMIHKLGILVCFRAIDTLENVRNAVDVKLDYLPTNTMWPALVRK